MTWLEWFWGVLERPIRIGDQIFAFSWLSLIVEWLLPLLATGALFILLGRLLGRWLGRMEITDDRKVKYARLYRGGSRILFVLLVAGLSLRFMDDTFLIFFQDIFTALGTPFYKAGSTQISIMTFIFAVPVFLVANLGGRAAKAALERSRVLSGNLSEARRGTLANLLHWGVMVFTLLLGLSVIGLDLTAIMVLLGVLGIGIGFGLQHLLSSFFAGLVIMVNRPFKEGDFLGFEASEGYREGHVRAIRMVNTLVVTQNNETLVVPNSRLVGMPVNNLSYLDQMYLFELRVTLGAGTDTEQAWKVIETVARDCPFRNEGAEPELRLAGIREGKPVVSLRLNLRSVSDRDEARAWLLEGLWSRQNRLALGTFEAV